MVVACSCQARTGQKGAVVLHVACGTKKMDAVRCLLRLTASGALVNAVNHRGQTLIDFARDPSTLLIRGVYLAVCRLLLVLLLPRRYKLQTRS